MPQKRSKRSLEQNKGIVIKRASEEDTPFEEARFIKSDIGHHFASLFRPISDKKGREKGRLVKWIWKFPEKKEYPGTVLIFDELEYEFACFEELGEDDLKVFLRLVQLAGIGKVVLDPWVKEYDGIDGKIVQQLYLFSDHISCVENSRTLPVIRSSKLVSYSKFFSPFLKGRIGRNHIKQLENSLIRLSRTTVTVTAKREGRKVRRMSSALISYAVNYETGRFFVAVNPFVANAILGKPLGGYRPLIDAAIFQLKGTVAIVLSWLSAWLLPGKAGKISLDMLEEHIYGDRSKDRKIRYWRRRKLRKALEEIGKLRNWQITEVRKGVYELKREEKKA